MAQAQFIPHFDDGNAQFMASFWAADEVVDGLAAELAFTALTGEVVLLPPPIVIDFEPATLAFGGQVGLIAGFEAITSQPAALQFSEQPGTVAGYEVVMGVPDEWVLTTLPGEIVFPQPAAIVVNGVPASLLFSGMTGFVTGAIGDSDVITWSEAIYLDYKPLPVVLTTYQQPIILRH